MTKQTLTKKQRLAAHAKRIERHKQDLLRVEAMPREPQIDFSKKADTNG